MKLSLALHHSDTPTMGIETTAAVFVAMMLTVFASLGAAFSSDGPALALLQPSLQQVASQAATEAVKQSVSPSSEMVTVNLSIIDNSKLRLFCIAGAGIGSLITTMLSVYLLPRASPREFLTKLIGSFLLSISMSPMIIRWTHFSIDAESILFASTVVATCGWGVLVAIKPIFERFVTRAATARLTALVPPPDKPEA